MYLFLTLTLYIFGINIFLFWIPPWGRPKESETSRSVTTSLCIIESNFNAAVRIYMASYWRFDSRKVLYSALLRPLWFSALVLFSVHISLYQYLVRSSDSILDFYIFVRISDENFHSNNYLNFPLKFLGAALQPCSPAALTDELPHVNE